MKTAIFKDALNRANVSIIQFHQILYLVQAINNLTDGWTVWTDKAATI